MLAYIDDCLLADEKAKRARARLGGFMDYML